MCRRYWTWSQIPLVGVQCLQFRPLFEGSNIFSASRAVNCCHDHSHLLPAIASILCLSPGPFAALQSTPCGISMLTIMNIWLWYGFIKRDTRQCCPIPSVSELFLHRQNLALPLLPPVLLMNSLKFNSLFSYYDRTKTCGCTKEVAHKDLAVRNTTPVLEKYMITRNQTCSTK